MNGTQGLDHKFGREDIDPRQKTAKVKALFENVTSNYDRMNDFMSLGIHRLWKRLAVQSLQLRPEHHVLDLACGTGDLASLLAPRLTQGKLTLSDLCESMLQKAQHRLLDEGFYVPAVQADAAELPFENAQFDRIIIGFGLRNMSQISRVFAQCHRVLKPGGKLVILEFSHPTNAMIKRFYSLYSQNVIPFLGRILHGEASPYQYLVDSIQNFAQAEQLSQWLTEQHFLGVTHTFLTGGIVALHTGYV